MLRFCSYLQNGFQFPEIHDLEVFWVKSGAAVWIKTVTLWHLQQTHLCGQMFKVSDCSWRTDEASDETPPVTVSEGLLTRGVAISFVYYLHYVYIYIYIYSYGIVTSRAATNDYFQYQLIWLVFRSVLRWKYSSTLSAQSDILKMFCFVWPTGKNSKMVPLRRQRKPENIHILETATCEFVKKSIAEIGANYLRLTRCCSSVVWWTPQLSLQQRVMCRASGHWAHLLCYLNVFCILQLKLWALYEEYRLQGLFSI